MTPNPIKVLLISPLPPPSGGIATWTIQYINWAKNNGIDVDIVNTAFIGKRTNNVYHKRFLFLEIKRSVYIIKELYKKILSFKPTIIHLNTPCAKYGIFRDYLCAKIARYFKIKLIVHYRCNIEDQLCNRTLQRKYFKKICKLASQNLVLNTPSKEYIERETACKCILVSNFICLDSVLSESKVINEEIRKIVFVGHVKKEKGVNEIIETAKRFNNIRFHIAGPLEVNLKQIQYPVNLIFEGKIEKSAINNLLDQADVFLFPSYTEGFANALLEAMARGLPIIATSVGANHDMILSEGGIIVKPQNFEDIYEAIIKIEDREIRRQMSEWNINRVKSDYLIDNVMQELISIYNK